MRRRRPTARPSPANHARRPRKLPAMNAPRVPGQFALLRERRFAPFFWTQFLGAANDNVFKNAFVVFVAFEAASRLDASTPA